MSHETVWDDVIDEGTQDVLDPGVPASLDRAPDVLVIGGGVIGLSIAASCRQLGIERVTVLEGSVLGAGPSRRAGGILAPEVHAMLHPGPFVDLARAGLQRHREWSAAWDGATGLRDRDYLLVSDSEVPEALRRLAGAQALAPADARRREPELGPWPHVLLLQHQASVHPLRLILALARRAGSIATGVTVSAFDTSGNRVVRVRTSAGRVTPGAVVVATGEAPRWLLPLAQVQVKGHIVATTPASFRLRGIVASTIAALQLDDGRLVCGGTFDAGDRQPLVRDAAVARIRAEMTRLLPASAELEIDRAWCCFRPCTEDELPVIDRLPGLSNAWLSVAHFRTGLLLAPAAGHAVASWIRSGVRPAELAGLGLDRLAPARLAD